MGTGAGGALEHGADDVGMDRDVRVREVDAEVIGASDVAQFNAATGVEREARRCEAVSKTLVDLRFGREERADRFAKVQSARKVVVDHGREQAAPAVPRVHAYPGEPRGQRRSATGQPHLVRVRAVAGDERPDGCESGVGDLHATRAFPVDDSLEIFDRGELGRAREGPPVHVEHLVGARRGNVNWCVTGPHRHALHCVSVGHPGASESPNS